MYSTETAITTSLNDIRQCLSDYDIYAYYMGKFQIGRLYNSPLRTTDENPSFAVFPARSGDLLFKDHGSGQSGNVITFVKLMENTDDIDKVVRKLAKIIKTTNPSKSAVQTYNTHTGGHIGIVRQDWTDTDIEYWSKFHISLDTLKLYDVFSIKYFLYNNIVKGTYNEKSPMYAYKVGDRFKIYRPLASKYTKWRTNLSNDDIQGLKQLDTMKDVLIITKSLKDVMVLYEMGYAAISPSSETTFIPERILPYITKDFKKVYILFDRDKTGMKRAREFSKKYNMEAFFINKKFKSKDISDAVMLNGFETVKNWLNNTLMKNEQ